MDIRKYIYGHCVHPAKVRMWDAYEQAYVMRELPCGKCLHCRKTRINEWVTRLYAQAAYSSYVYYITLDYAPFSYEKDTFPDPTAHLLAIETAAVWHNINHNHVYGMQPLLLRKHHLQNFIKRFRKNTGKQIQYFACGEYGTHAEGKGYGRPHFHAIVFCNEKITQGEFQDAWTLNDYRIGNVEYEDITLEAKCKFKSTPLNNAKHVFAYVCKYLQKSGFDFESLATIDYHRALVESLEMDYRKRLAFDGIIPELTPEQKRLLWNEYTKDFAPFVVCSRRPAIGLAYLTDNIQRFKTQDFRLFGLPSECVALPNYYVRKVKESYCQYVSLGSVSSQPSTSSRLGNVISLLLEIYNDRLDFSRFCSDFQHYRRSHKSNTPGRFSFRGRLIDYNELHFYDTKNNIMYQFNGYSYTLWAKVKKLGFVKMQDMDIADVLHEVPPYFQNYYDNYVSKMHDMRVLKEAELTDYINSYLPGETFADRYAQFQKLISTCLSKEEQYGYCRSLFIKNDKISF